MKTQTNNTPALHSFSNGGSDKQIINHKSDIINLTEPSTFNLQPSTSSATDHGLLITPWPEPVSAPALLDDLAATLTRFVILPTHAATALALWIIHTYAFKLRDVTTYIGIESPEKQCGKTTLLAVLNELVNRAVAASNVSPPAFFRVIEDLSPTLLIDEGDTFLKGNDQLRGILNAGYKQKTAFVLRAGPAAPYEFPCRSRREDRSQRSPAGPRSNTDTAIGAPSPRGPRSAERSPNLGHPSGGGLGKPLGRGEGDRDAQSSGQLLGNEARSRRVHGQRDFEDDETTTESIGQVTRFSCWCPKVIATIGHLPDTLADRCIVIRMQRKTPHEKCDRLRALVPLPLKQKCARFVLDHQNEIAAAEPVTPPQLSDRGAEIWEPLLAIADLAGDQWPDLARKAALALAASAQQSSPIASLMLDMYVIFTETGQDRLFSRDLVEQMNNRFAERPWMDLDKTFPLTDRCLSQHLRPYGIKPKMLRIGDRQARGYRKEDCLETFRRYISRADLDALTADSTS